MLYSFLKYPDYNLIRKFENELNTISERQVLINYTLKTIKTCFDVDFVGWNEMHPTSPIFLDAHIYPQIPSSVAKEIQDPMIYYAPQNPSLNFYYNRSLNWTATSSLDDIVSMRKFQSSALYNETYKKFDANWLLFFHFPGHLPSRIFLILTRKKVPYSLRERALLDCMGNQIANRLKKINNFLNRYTLMNMLQDAFEADNPTYLQINSKLEIIKQNAQLKPLFRTFFPEESLVNGLPKPIYNWMENCLYNQKTGIQQIGVSFQKSTVFKRWNRNLLAIWIKRPSETYSILSLQEDEMAKMEYDRIISQLTRRQRQIFHLLQDGSTNIEQIAKTLGISKRTAEGHKQNLMHTLSTLG